MIIIYKLKMIIVYKSNNIIYKSNNIIIDTKWKKSNLLLFIKTYKVVKYINLIHVITIITIPPAIALLWIKTHKNNLENYYLIKNYLLINPKGLHLDLVNKADKWVLQ